MSTTKSKKDTKAFVSDKDGDRKSRGFYVFDEVKDISFWRDVIIPAQHIQTLLVCEPPDEGATVYHVYIYFSNVRLLRAIIKLFGQKRGVFISDESPRVSYYNVRSGVEEFQSEHSNCVQVRKAVLLHHWGEDPQIPKVIYDYTGAPAGQGDRSDIETVFRDIKEGKYIMMQQIAEDHPVAFCKFGSKIKEYMNMVHPERNWKTEVYCLWGEGGFGKTHDVFFKEGEGNYNKGLKKVETVNLSGDSANPFVLKYTGTKEAILIDDWNPEKWDVNWFLNVSDRHPCTVNVKGGEANWNPKRLYLTSNFHPSTWWGGWSQQVKRRFTQIIEVKCDNPNADQEPDEVILHKKTPTDGGVTTKVDRRIEARKEASLSQVEVITKAISKKK